MRKFENWRDVEMWKFGDVEIILKMG